MGVQSLASPGMKVFLLVWVGCLLVVSIGNGEKVVEKQDDTSLTAAGLEEGWMADTKAILRYKRGDDKKRKRVSNKIDKQKKKKKKKKKKREKKKKKKKKKKK